MEKLFTFENFIKISHMNKLYKTLLLHNCQKNLLKNAWFFNCDKPSLSEEESKLLEESCTKMVSNYNYNDLSINKKVINSILDY